ncbi:MAG: DNA mismatch repair endonuclease MutL [Candidatus Hodarchaeota archaeon]
MTKIQFLDPVVISKIAAGEVIERPGSVVKELIENSLDALATEIQISIKNGGKDSITVKDNGIGILPEDLPKSIKRHATSKISTEQDLESISTLGFRGEALYSIASVSRFTITSKTSKDELATSVSVNGNVDTIQVSERAMASPGTIILVNDLFFNFPVRRKFLKKAFMEEGYIYDIVTQYAIVNPEISFTLIIDGETEFQTIKGQNHLSVIKETLGKDIANSLLDVGIVQRDEILIQGYLSKPGHHKRNRKYQFFFLNGRRIYSNLLQSALEEGYGTYLMKREFPIAFLFLELNPKNFDVNIHPQKREVLFFDEKILRIAVSSAVSNCLKMQDIVPRLAPSKQVEKQSRLGFKESMRTDTSLYSKNSRFKGMNSQINVHPEHKASEISNYFNGVGTAIPEVTIRQSETLNLFGSDLTFRGSLGDEFLLFEDSLNHDLIVLDFHATHERVNLEKLSQMYRTKRVISQTFLKPFRFSANKKQIFIIKESISHFNALGFDLRIPKGEKHVIEVHAIPKILINTDLKRLLSDIFDNIDVPIVEDQVTELLSILACHCSYRSNKTLSFRQAKELLLELTQTENPNICAHGRPTYFRITYHDMLKKVKRV